MNPVRPYHAQQLARSLPSWTTHLHSSAVEAIMSAQRHPYLQADGQAEPWYLSAAAQQREALRAALKQRGHSLEALHKALQPLQGLTEFCQPLLQQALAIPAAVDRAVYFFQPFKRRPFVQVEGESGLAAGLEHEQFEYDPSGTARKVSLLEAALHNFVDSAETGPYSELHSSRTDSTRLVGLSVRGFVQTCRQLDLGQRYQDHLASLYDGEQAALLEAHWCQASRDELRVHAQIAAMQDRLDALGLSAIEQLCAHARTPSHSGEPWVCRRLELFGVPLHDVLVIGPAQPGAANPCILFIPGAPDAPLQQYSSAQAAAAGLTRRMQHSAMLQWMIRRAPQALQAALFKRVTERLFDRPQPPTVPPLLPKPDPHLDFATHPLPAAPWARLYAAHVARLKADAACLAVPTAQVDAQARLALLEHIASVGMDLANVAALFLPGLNGVMLAVGGAQLMNSVFHGIEAWEQDDKAQAAAQLESVLLNIALMGAIGGGVAVLKSSRFVDSLISIEHAGGERLWRPELASYSTNRTLPASVTANARGQLLHQGRFYARLDGRLYEQRLGADGQWRLVHPADPHAYQPVMRQVGEGAWRIEGEQPLDWPRQQLLSRLAGDAEDLAEADLDAALRCTGLDEDTLRHVHVSEGNTPPLLADALNLLRVDQNVDQLIGALRHGASVANYPGYVVDQLLELPGWPADHLVKVFDGPEAWGPSTLYGSAARPEASVVTLTRNDLELGQLSQTVLSQLDESAASALLPSIAEANDRASALNGVLADALGAHRTELIERIYTAAQPPLSEEAQVLQRQFNSLSQRTLETLVAHASALERTRLGSGRVPLRIAEEARSLQARGRLDRALLGLYQPRLANADSATLQHALQTMYPEASPAQRLQHALLDRRQTARLLGQQPQRAGYRSPLRLADGRFGYPLSGRGRWREWIRQATTSIEERRLQELYPALSAPERRALVETLRQRGDAAEQIRHLQRERTGLQRHLQRWVSEADAAARHSRQQFEQAITRAARRDDGATLTLEHMTLEQLPALPARLDHITSLNLQGLGLQSLSGEFLQSFPRLEHLRLSRNPRLQPESLMQALRQAPRLRTLAVTGSPIGALDDAGRATLAHLRGLRALRLHGVDLALGEADWQTLAALPLEHLQLSDNAITLSAQAAARIGQMTRLTELNLSHNPLGMAPELATLEHLQSLDLSGCGLQEWPHGLSALMQRPDYALRTLHLSENAIHELPTLDDILASAYASDLLSEHRLAWEFHFNQLAPEQAQRLRAIGVGIVEHADFLAEDQTVDWRASANPDQRQQWDALFDQDNHRALREVLERVGRSAQAQHNQQSLGAQVWRLIEAASHDQGLRQRLDEVASDFPPSCGDAGADGFSTLEVELLAYRESSNAEIPTADLFGFYRRLFRREQVNVLAARIHAARLARQAAFLTWLGEAPELRTQFPQLPALDELDDISLTELEQGGVDDIEIRLALRQATAPTLDFPEPSQDMLYRESAHISSITSFNVEQAVLELDGDSRARQAWIAAQPSWRRLLRQRFALHFGALDRRWYQGMEYLDYCLDPEAEPVTELDGRVREHLAEALPAPLQDGAGRLQRMALNSQQYQAALDRLMSERQAELEALYTRLTRQQDALG
ncbi:NEL-type E3 ubiquitin ligase domain-containing protein [Pseudomonas sp.]|uniref:NEL-type E3 ubiquitin ligase domain-containing protein n=1 Tax=Pseudomonas sp. TaxID=306 RepID=UPI0028AF1FAD|nr:DUF6543 domain-containing protein [Pseudomonas sp.]